MPSYEITDDQQAVIFNGPDGTQTRYDLAAAEDMIALWGEIRGKLRPLPPSNPDEGRKAARPLQSQYFLLGSPHGNPLQVGALMLVHSDEFGWFDFPMTPDRCHDVVNWLVGNAQALAPPPDATLN